MDAAELRRRLSWICQCAVCQELEAAILTKPTDADEADEFYAELKARLDERAPA